MSAAAACESLGVNRRQGYRWITAAGGRIPVPAVASSGRYLGQEERLHPKRQTIIRQVVLQRRQFAVRTNSVGIPGIGMGLTHMSG